MRGMDDFFLKYSINFEEALGKNKKSDDNNPNKNEVKKDENKKGK